MSKYIAVADSYIIYEVQDDAFEMLSNLEKINPPQVVLEVLCYSGVAKKVGTVGSFKTTPTSMEPEEDDEDPPEGEGPWVE